MMNALAETTAFLQERDFRAGLGLVLGSGLGSLGDAGEVQAALPFTAIPHFLPAGVEGHAGRLLLRTVGGVTTLVLQGRLHYYEGHSLATIVFPVRVLARLGVRVLVLTNAAGGLNPGLAPGDLMLINDHLNLMGANPLIGPNWDELGPRFPSLTGAYAPDLIAAALAAAARAGIQLRQGVYAAVTGPSYETAAEARFLRGVGADAVGMSTVPEVIAARHAGVQVLGISCITNMLGGADSPSHPEVLAVAREAGVRLGKLLAALAPLLPEDASRAGG